MESSPDPLDVRCVNVLRGLAIDAVQKAKSGHPGMPLGAAPMAFALWMRHLRHHPGNPRWPNRDRFVLSAGHGSALLYALLHLTGYDLPLDQLKRFRQWGSLTPGHPENTLTPGVEMATGPLGQGFATAVGMAIAERFLAATFNRPGHEVVDHRTYVICSDGDLMEGVSAEAASLAGHLKLSKLICLYDDNGITIDGSTRMAFTEDVPARFKALGWRVRAVEDGMSVDQVDAALREAKSASGGPTLIVCPTVIGYGSPNKAGSAKSHGAALGDEEVRLTKQALGLPPDEQFWIPGDVLERFRATTVRGANEEKAWARDFARYEQAFPVEAAKLKGALSGDLPGDLWQQLPGFDSAVATRVASGKTLNAVAGAMPTLIGGSADLAESNNTWIEGSEAFQADTPSGRNLCFGVREHAMACAVNGMNLHGGVRAYGASFLIFSDYCRPAIRLAALMRCPSVFVFTHDSVGLGEDGPTHQPIEHLMSLRAIPNLAVMRPADANETAVCWMLALARNKGPSLLALTRQSVPIVSPPHGPDHPARKGAYVLRDTDTAPDVILLGTGSEVSVCLQAGEALHASNIRARIVSMPCWEVFEEQDAAYRRSVLPRGVPTVSVEAGATLGWSRYSDAHVGIDRFGASAPGDVALRELGINAEAVARAAVKLINARWETASASR